MHGSHTVVFHKSLSDWDPSVVTRPEQHFLLPTELLALRSRRPSRLTNDPKILPVRVEDYIHLYWAFNWGLCNVVYQTVNSRWDEIQQKIVC